MLMIILAHDGSIYSDWVARYALRFAAGEEDRKLLVLHVDDDKISSAVVENRFSQLANECDSFNVEFFPQHLSSGSSVHRTLRQAIPNDPKNLLICGTRFKPRRQRYLSGTISEKLLRMHQCPVVALRVVQPGLLGNPHDLLLPLAGHTHGYIRIDPIIRRLKDHLRSVQLLRAMRVNSYRHPYLTPHMERTLKTRGYSYLKKFKHEMEQSLGPLAFRCELRVTISSDWVDDALTHASRFKTQLMLLGLSERNLAYQVFHSDSLEKALHETPCDIGIYRGP